MRREIVSPEQFDILQREIQRLDSLGHNAEEVVFGACKLAGIAPPKPFEGVEVIVLDQQPAPYSFPSNHRGTENG